MKNINLELFIPESTSTCSFKVEDISYYPVGAIAYCRELDVLVPGFKYSVVFNFSENNWSTILNAYNLKLTDEKEPDEGPLLPLPDGVYVLKYTINNSKDYNVTYYYMRTQVLMMRFKNVLCCIKDRINYISDKDISVVLQKISDIEGYLLLSRTSAEVCHDVDKAIKFYCMAAKEMKQLSCSYCPDGCIDDLGQGCLSCR